MRKTFEVIDSHVPAPSAYLPLRPAAEDCSETLEEVRPPDLDPATVDETVRALDPDVVVQNHRFAPERFAFTDEYPVVHVRHGASVGRGEVWNTTDDLGDVVDVALAPGDYWATHYREHFPEDVEVAVVGVPEADSLVGAAPPDDGRVLYAPTNHNYGGGSYLATAEDVLDAFEGADFELMFRPHPMDRLEEPGRSLTRRCRERIETMPNVEFDESDTPRESLEAADLLISDCSGIVVEWLHADRPLLQVTTLAGDADVPPLGYRTDDVRIDLVTELYESGYPRGVREARDRHLAELGVPMDGRAGERAAREVMACTP